MIFKHFYLRWMAAVFALILSMAAQADTKPLAPPFYIDIQVSTPAVIFGKVKLSDPGPPIKFRMNVAANYMPDFSGNNKFDYYFGLVRPGQPAISIVPVTGSTGTVQGLAEGLVPLGRDVAILEKEKSSSSFLGGQDATYQFSAQDEPGLYLIYGFVVDAGADPSDTDNWWAQDSIFFAVLP